MAVPDAGEKIYETLREIMKYAPFATETNQRNQLRIGWPESEEVEGDP